MAKSPAITAAGNGPPAPAPTPPPTSGSKILGPKPNGSTLQAPTSKNGSPNSATSHLTSSKNPPPPASLSPKITLSPWSTINKHATSPSPCFAAKSLQPNNLLWRLLHCLGRYLLLLHRYLLFPGLKLKDRFPLFQFQVSRKRSPFFTDKSRQQIRLPFPEKL